VPAYVVAQITINDPDRYKDYIAGFYPSFLRHGGEILASTRQETTVLEGEWARARTVILRFPDRAAALAWHADPDYRALMAIRHEASDGNLVVVDGL
jgi:uncharacterized protein (DUF1330 family)